MRPVAALAVVTLLASGCGLGGEDDDHPIAAADVPYDLLAPSTTTTTEPPTTTTTLAWRANLWFVIGGRLQPVQRQLRTQPHVEQLLDLLLRGPSGADSRLLRTALAVDDARVPAQPSGGVLVVELADDFGARSSSEQIFALGQLVFTLTEVPGIGRVLFRIDGADLAVPRPDGQLVQGSVSRDDYRSLISPAP